MSSPDPASGAPPPCPPTASTVEQFQPVSMQMWLRASTLKLLLFTFGFGFLIFLASVGLDGIMLRENTSPRMMVELSDALAGAIAGLLFYLYARARRKEMLRRLQAISEMNHHIRNALQVISSSAYLPEKKEVEAINDSIQRIQWALREILPKI